MSEVILKVENVSKLYRLGTVGTGTFGGDVQRFWKTKILGQEDPFLKIGQTNDRTSKEKADFVWALKDINFEVKRGEVLGIIGKNGAGKSTLLKLLSRITSPTTGSIKSAGRMASLLEVGTGFHPELTGRENIFLNGAILGMTKKEIQSKFDEIVDFSGCELYIDTPTKRYSSGMTVRLGFAVAAFLDPEILVVDEVLAVGDAEFQKKAIGKMKDISQGEGRTVLFVSHNMASLLSFCERGLLLQNGKIDMISDISDVVKEYLSINQNISLKNFADYVYENDLIRLLDVKVENELQNNSCYFDKPILISFLILSRDNFKGLSVASACTDSMGNQIFTARTTKMGIDVEKGENKLTLTIPAILRPGTFTFNLGISIGGRSNLYYLENCIDIQVTEIGEKMKLITINQGIINIESKWEVKHIKN